MFSHVCKFLKWPLKGWTRWVWMASQSNAWTDVYFECVYILDVIMLHAEWRPPGPTSPPPYLPSPHLPTPSPPPLTSRSGSTSSSRSPPSCGGCCRRRSTTGRRWPPSTALTRRVRRTQAAVSGSRNSCPGQVSLQLNIVFRAYDNNSPDSV